MIQLRPSHVVIGVTAYYFGYVRGVRSAGRINEGLYNLGEGLKAFAEEVSQTNKKPAEPSDAVIALTEDQVQEIKDLAQGGTRTNSQIALQLDIPEELVAEILDGGTR